MNTKTNASDLTQGNIYKILIGLALPIIGSSFLQLTYGLIDMIWIGKLGSDAIAAVGTANFVINMCIAVNTMVSTGTGIKSSHTIGEKRLEKNKEYISTGIYLNMILFIICVVFIILFSKPILNIFNINQSVTTMSKDYLFISSFGLFFKFQNFFYSRIYNSFGESKLPFKINLIGVGLNIFLDPLFIFNFNLGVSGAAYATIIAEAVVALLLIKNSKKFFVLDRVFPMNLNCFTDIIKLGFPLSLQRIMFTMFSIVIARIVSEWGAEAIAAQKIGIQIESLAYMTIGGLHGAIVSFIGQNYGAKQYNRILHGYKIALSGSIQLGIFLSIIFYFFAEPLARIFISDIKTIELTISYLQIVGLSQAFMCVEIITNGAFNGIGNSKIPSTLSIFFTGMRIPLAIFLSQENMYSIDGVWMTIAITTVFKGVVTAIWYFNTLYKNVLTEVSYE